MKKEIIEILNRNLLSNRAEALQKLCDESEIFCNYIDKIASEILPMIEKRDAIIDALEELIKAKDITTDITIKAWKLLYAGKGMPVDMHKANDDKMAELRQKISELKKELK